MNTGQGQTPGQVDILSLLLNAGGDDWKAEVAKQLVHVFAKTELAMQLLKQPEVQQVIKSAFEFRTALARVLLERGMITEEEAKPYKEGGLSMAQLLKRSKE